MATRNMNKEKNESLTKQVELSHLKEQIKYIKRTLDILLERQWIVHQKTMKKAPQKEKKSEIQTETNQKIQKPRNNKA